MQYQNPRNKSGVIKTINRIYTPVLNFLDMYISASAMLRIFIPAGAILSDAHARTLH